MKVGTSAQELLIESVIEQSQKNNDDKLELIFSYLSSY